jgi:hypothetical protein
MYSAKVESNFKDSEEFFAKLVLMGWFSDFPIGWQ